MKLYYVIMYIVMLKATPQSRQQMSISNPMYKFKKFQHGMMELNMYIRMQETASLYVEFKNQNTIWFAV